MRSDVGTPGLTYDVYDVSWAKALPTMRTALLLPKLEQGLAQDVDVATRSVGLVSGEVS